MELLILTGKDFRDITALKSERYTREREKRKGETDRHTGIKTDRDRLTERERKRETERGRKRETERDRHTHTHTHTNSEKLTIFVIRGS